MTGTGGAFGGNTMGGFGGNMTDMGGGFGGNTMGGNMSDMGGNEGAFGHALDNDTSPLHYVDKEADDDDDCTMVHNAGGVDDPHE